MIGARGVTIGEIMKRSGCKVFINQHYPEGQLHKVVYTGSAQQIDIARYLIDTVIVQGMAALYAIFNGQESVVMQEMNLAEPQAARLRSSDVPNELQNRYGVKVCIDQDAQQLPSSSSASAVRLSIIGKTDLVRTAMKFIYQFLGSGPMEPPSQPFDLISVVAAPPSAPPSQSLNSSSSAAGQSQSSSVYHSSGGGGTGRLSAGSSSGPQQQSLPASAYPNTGPILALGKDGTSGHLESAFSLPDGSHQQVAEVNNDCMGRIIGARSTTISLIKSKSGVNVQVLKADQSKNTTRVILTGAPPNVTLAAQMIQEVLVNGTAKLLKMPDAPSPPPPTPQMKSAGPPMIMASPLHPDRSDAVSYYNSQQHGMPPPHHTLPGHHPPSGPQFYGGGGIPMYPGTTLSPPVRKSFHIEPNDLEPKGMFS